MTTSVHLRHLHAIDNASLVYERRIEIVLENLIRCLSCNKISIIQLREYNLVYIGKISYLINSLEM